MSAFGDEIRRLREARGWSIEEASTRMFGRLTDIYLKHVESGYFDADFAEVVCIAAALDAPFAHLLRLSGCALPPGLTLVEEGSCGDDWTWDYKPVLG